MLSTFGNRYDVSRLQSGQNLVPGDGAPATVRLLDESFETRLAQTGSHESLLTPRRCKTPDVNF